MTIKAVITGWKNRLLSPRVSFVKAEKQWHNYEWDRRVWKEYFKRMQWAKIIAIPQITAELSSNHPFGLLLDTSDFHRLIHGKLLPWWLRRLSICLQCGRPGFDPWVGEIPWRRKWQSTPVLLPGKSHGQKSLAGCSLWGRKESDTTEQLHFTSLYHIFYPSSFFSFSALCLQENDAKIKTISMK